MDFDNVADLARTHVEPPPVPDVRDAEKLIQHRRRMRWLSRVFMLLALGGLLAALHWITPDWVGESFAMGALAGWAFGLIAADLRLFSRNQPETVTEVVSQDLAHLEKCFAILQKQVTVTIRTSEQAVLETVSRLNRVHRRSAELHQHIVDAVGRSRVLSESSQQEASGNQNTVATLAASQEAFAKARQDNQIRIRNVVEQVRVEGVAQERLKIDTRDLEVTHLRLVTVGTNVTRDVWLDGDGRLVKARIPALRLDAVRDDR